MLMNFWLNPDGGQVHTGIPLIRIFQRLAASRKCSIGFARIDKVVPRRRRGRGLAANFRGDPRLFIFFVQITFVVIFLNVHLLKHKFDYKSN